MPITRRRFVKLAGVAGALWAGRVPRCAWAAVPGGPDSACRLDAASAYAPLFQPFLQQIEPGHDEFLAEKYAFELEAQLRRWSAAPHDVRVVANWLPQQLEAARLQPNTIITLRGEAPLETEKVVFPPPASIGRDEFLSSLAQYVAPFTRVDFCDLSIDAIEIVTEEPLVVRTNVHYNLSGELNGGRREQRTGNWSVEWRQQAPGNWRIARWSAPGEMRARLTGPGFVDIAAQALGHNDSYTRQMLQGLDHWRTVMDAASGIDVYGNNGVCVGDFDGDGLDDIYVCQPAGLPNRLYKNNGDGTFDDVTEKAGVDVLDGTACALFADLRNSGHQDLIVVRDAGPLLFINRGDGTFELKPNAFAFAHPPHASFTGASLADYNRDGLLDVYFCTYSKSEGTSGNEHPTPYYDAQNGPPNYLMRNRGDHTFEDVTVPSGLDVNNSRFSFAAVWADYNGDGWPDLFVVNDFGRKALYRNNGNGTFTDVSAEAGVEDPGEGMSMTWVDYDNDGREDIYAVNMWEPAGCRVTSQPQFLPAAPANVRSIVRRDALGNTLLHAEDGGKFSEKTDDAGARLGGWNWGSDAWDLDHDGYADLYVANGFISGENRQDLSSFFWRHIAARALDAGGRGRAYTDAWSAINEFIRSDYTWSGYQRNNLYVNNRNATFTEAASVLGMGCIEDGRSFALSDLDGDGRLEVVLKNRTAPQLRILQNRLHPIGASIVFALRGTKSNRDAIGAVITLDSTHAQQTRTVRAGSGFLSQSSKAVHFGVGNARQPLRATIHWPGGTQQVLENLPANHRIEVVEGVETFRAVPLKEQTRIEARGALASAAQPAQDTHATWLLDPIAPPAPALKDAAGATRPWKQENRAQLLAFVAAGCSESADFLLDLERGRDKWMKAGIGVMAVVMDAEQQAAAALPHVSYPVLFADAKASRTFEVFRRYLFDRRRPMTVPSALLVDDSGNVVRVYHAAVSVDELIADAHNIPRTGSERMQRGLPFPGHYYGGALRRDLFTLGLAYMQYEAYGEAQSAFQASVERNPNNSTAWYDLGLIALYGSQPAEARRCLERAAALDPENADVWNNLGVAMGQSGDAQRARRDFEHALELQPAHPNALQNMMRVLRSENNPQQARDLLTKAIAADPNSAEAHKQMGMLLLDMGDIAAARGELEKAVALGPSNPDALNALGVVYMQTREDDQALQMFTRCARLAPDFAGPVLNMAVIYISAGKTAEARAALSDFLKKHPENQDVRQALSEVGGRP